ncbi:MAG: right-handed parallel beta-helix repeat-containing protein, partial [Phycisphaerae bacterium]
FFARAQGYVKDDTTGVGIPGAKVNIRLKDGSAWLSQITDATGWYRFDDLPEVEVLAYIDVTLPAGYRGAIVTDTFYPGAYWINSNCNPIQFPSCVELGPPYEVTHNGMNRYIQWYTANYNADLLLEPIPPAAGDISGFVYYDHLATGTWAGNGTYDEEDDRTLPGVTVELWDSAGTTLLATTTTGAFDKAATLAQGWHEPFTMPLDEWGGVFVGPMPGFYEFRDLAPGDYTVKVIAPAGFSASPAASDSVALTVTAGARNDLHFGMNTLVPLSGQIEGGVFDDVFVDPRLVSLMYLEKAGIDKAPVGIYDHLGYFLGAGFQGNPMCYHGASVGTDVNTQCPIGESLGQKPELERRIAPTALLYLGNDPSLPGYNDEYLPLIMPYTMGQGQYKFEADWSLVPVAFGQGPTHDGIAPLPPPAPAQAAAPPAPVIQEVTDVGGYMLLGENFGAQRGFSTVTLSGRELYVTSWSDTEIHVGDPIDPISGPMIVTSHAGPSNAVPVEIAYDSNRAQYMAERSVFVDSCNTGAEDGSQAAPWSTLGEALTHLPAATPRYVFVAAGYYNERVQITESDIQIIGAGPQETTIDGLGSMQLSMESQGFVGRGPVFFIGQGGEFGGVSNILISGLTITRGSVDDDIGCGIFGDAGNRNIDINTCIIDHNGGYYGGGIWLQKTNHDVRIWSNTISNNGCAGGYSGGISVNDEPEYGPHHGEPEHVIDDEIPGCPPGTYEIFNNHLLHNFSPDYGGAVALYEVKDQLIVAGNLIEDNHADDHGGGVFFEDSGPVELYGNIIRRNSNYDDGGAISFEDVTDHNAVVRVHHNVIARNWADDHGENHVRGGAIAFDDTFYAEIFNNTIVENVAAGSRDPVGGAIDSERHGHEYNGSEPLGRDFAPGFSDVMIYGNIIWGNLRLKYDQKQHSDEEDLDWTFGINHVWTPDNFHVDDPAVQVESESHLNSDAFSLVEFNCIDNGEYADRLGTVNLDPLFVNPDQDDWHLQLDSPVADMGAYAGGGGLPDAVGTISPLAAPEPMCNATCFAINEVTVDPVGNVLTANGTCSALLLFDPEIDGVGFSIVDGSGYTVDFWIPPGSFVVDGAPGMGGFSYTGPVLGMNMQVDARITGCGFTITTTRAPRISRPIGTKMMLSLSVGTTLGREAILLAESNGQLTYVRASQFECCPIQPIAFDHAEHMEKHEANLSCLDCHGGAVTQDYAGLPGKAVCFNCHTAGGGGSGGHDGNEGEDEHHGGNKKHGKHNDKKKIYDNSDDEDDNDDHHGGENGGGGLHKLDELLPYMNNDVELPWTPMAILRPGVTFSHGRHVTEGQVDCLICHADQAFLSRPREVVYRVMTMRQCRVCHEEYGARNDCQACHAYSFGPDYIAGE